MVVEVYLRGVWLMSGEYVSGIERLPRAWITASSGLCSWWSLRSKFPERRLRSGNRGVPLVGVVLLWSKSLLRLLKMFRMFMWLFGLFRVWGLVGLSTLLATGLPWSPAAGGVSIELFGVIRVWLFGVILMSSMAKIPLSLCAWISCRARVVCRVVGERGLNVLNRPGCSSMMIVILFTLDN